MTRALSTALFGVLLIAGAIYVATNMNIPIPMLGKDDPEGFPIVLRAQKTPTDGFYSRVVGYYPSRPICRAARDRWMGKNKPLRAKCMDREL